MPVSASSMGPPLSLLSPKLAPAVTRQSLSDMSNVAIAAGGLPAVSTAFAHSYPFVSHAALSATPPSPPARLTSPTASPGSPSRTAVAAKVVSDRSMNQAAARVIPLMDSTVSAAAMLMSIAATTPESSTSTAGCTTSQSASATGSDWDPSASSSPISYSAVSASSLSPFAASSAALSLALSSPASQRAPMSTSAFVSSSFSSLLSPRSPYQSFSPSPFLPTSLASLTLSSAALFSTSSSLFSTSFPSLPSLPSPLLASIRPGPLTPATTSSLVSSLANPKPKPKPAPPMSSLDRFVNYLHPMLAIHPGSLAPSITLPQLRVLAANNFHQLIALAVSVQFNPRRPYPGHRGKEEKFIICRNGWNALRNFISTEREKAWRAEMSGLSVREQRAYKKQRREDRRLANAAIREGRMAKFLDIANEYNINYSAYVKLGDEHSGRLRFRQMKAEQKDAAANALVNSSALISASNVNVAISSTLPAAGPMMANALPTTLAAVVNEQLMLAAPLTPTSSSSASFAASFPHTLASPSYSTSAAGLTEVMMSAASGSNGSGSGSSNGVSDLMAGKRRWDHEGDEVSEYGKRVRAEQFDSVDSRALPLPTEDELSGLPLLSPKSDTAMTVVSHR